MSTIIRQDGFEIRVYTRDHTPAHVHCYKAGAELIINLDPLSIRKNRGMSRKDAEKAVDIVTEHHAQLIANWRKYYGSASE